MVKLDGGKREGIKYMKQRCVVFGTGKYGCAAYQVLEEKYDIIGFSDNNEEKWGKSFCDKPIIKPEKLLELEDVIIVIASQFYSAINKQLGGMGIKDIWVFWYMASIHTVSDKTAYKLYRLPEQDLFENYKADWQKIDEIKKDFSKNYDEVVASEKIQLKKENGLKKVLFCAYLFPPIGGAAVQRSLKFVKYLRKYGYEPIVLTSTPDSCNHYVVDETLLNEIEDDITIIRISNDIYLPEVMSEKEQTEVMNLLAGVLGTDEWVKQYIKIVGELDNLLLPETFICWVNRCLRVIESKLDLNEIDVIYTTGAPFSTYLLGYYIKNKYGIPWVQDYRDPWCTNEYCIKFVWRFFEQTISIQQKLEENLLKESNAVVVMAENMIDEFDIMYGVDKSKFVEINNGYDEADFINVKIQIDKNTKFTLCHNGHMYIERNPIPLVQAINKLIAQTEIDREKIQIMFNGVVENKWKQLIDEEDKYGIVQYNGYMSHQESLEIAMNADVLLLFGEIGEGSKVIYTGKVFEYLRMKKPVFCFSAKGGVLDKLINETRTGKNIEYDDYDSIEEYLMLLYKKWERGERAMEVKEEEIEKYSRENETKRLAAVFDSIQER